jgi:Mg-chelatase subunit ChlD
LTRKLLLAALLLIAAVVPGTARADDPVTGQILDVDDSDFPTVRVVITLNDSTGRALSSLATNAFSAEESGARADVSNVEISENQQIGLGVVLTIDTSASMRGEPLDQAASSARAFVQSLRPSDQAGVVSFASGVSVQSGLTADRAGTLAAFDNLVGFGDTALYDAVIESVKLAQTSALPRRAIVFISDGGIGKEVSTSTRTDSLTAARDGGIPFYTIGLGSEVDRNYLRDLALQTGGAYLDAPSPAAIPALYDQLSQLLKAEYLVTLQSKAREDLAARNVRLTITTPAGVAQLRSDYTSRRTIVSPTQAPPPPPAASTGESSSKAPIYVGGGLLGLLAAVAFGVLISRWNRDRTVSGEIVTLSQRAAGLAAVPAPLGGPPDPDLALVVQGPQGSTTFAIKREPCTIGSGEGCQIQLREGGGLVAEQQARVWSNAGKLVFHQLAANTTSLVKGAPVTWTSLSPGSEIQMGPYVLKVEIAGAAS